MTTLNAGRAVALAANELGEASLALQAVERALLTDAAPVEGDAFPRDLQQLDLLAQSIAELRLYLDRLAEELEPGAATLDLSGPLSAVRLGDMRARLADRAEAQGGAEVHGAIDLF